MTFQQGCLDRFEHRSHLAGAFGAAIVTRWTEEHWIVRTEKTRAHLVTSLDREQFKRSFAPTFWPRNVTHERLFSVRERRIVPTLPHRRLRVFQRRVLEMMEGDPVPKRIELFRPDPGLMVSCELPSNPLVMPGADMDFMIELTPELHAFLANPPSGSATARARDFGYDVVALAIKLATTTPDQRLTALDQRIGDIRALRKSMT